MSCRVSSYWKGIVTLAVVATAGLPRAAAAYCDPKVDHSIRGDFHRSKYVVVAKVESEQWLDEKGRPAKLKPPFQEGSPIPLAFDPYSGAIYRIRVLQQFKGPRAVRISIFSENTEARTPLVRGRWLLLFVERRTEDLRDLGDPDFGMRNVVDYCGASRAVHQSDRILAKLERLKDARH